MTEDKLNELMAITAEECAELTHECMKVFRFGLEQNNRDRLLKEAGDVMAMIEIMIENDILTKEEISARITVKKDKLKIWSNLYEP